MNSADIKFLLELEHIIAERLANPTAESYTAALLASGDKRVAQKVGEEAVELALAAVAGDRAEQLEEAADLLYHLQILLVSKNLPLTDVVAVLNARHTTAQAPSRSN